MPTPTTEPTTTIYPTNLLVHDDYYTESPQLMTKFWSSTVFGTFCGVFAVAWLLDMFSLCDKFIQSKCILANHRIRYEKGKLNMEENNEDAIYDKDFPEVITSISEKDYPKNSDAFKLCGRVNYKYYMYCPLYREFLLSGRLYYTGDKFTDLVLFLCNQNAFLSMFAAAPEHPFSRNQRRIQFIFYHGLALLMSVCFGMAFVDEPDTMMITNCLLISPTLFVLRYGYYVLFTCPCFVKKRDSTTLKDSLLFLAYFVGTIGLLGMLIGGIITNIDNYYDDDKYDDDGELAKRQISYSKKLVVDYMMGVFLISTGNDLIVASIEFNFFNDWHFKSPLIPLYPLFHIGKWQHEKEYYNNEQYLIDYKKTFMETSTEVCKSTASSIKTTIGKVMTVCQSGKIIDSSRVSNQPKKSYLDTLRSTMNLKSNSVWPSRFNG